MLFEESNNRHNSHITMNTQSKYSTIGVEAVVIKILPDSFRTSLQCSMSKLVLKIQFPGK